LLTRGSMHLSQKCKPVPFEAPQEEAGPSQMEDLDTMVQGALDGDSSKVDAKAKLAAMQAHLASLMSKIEGS